MRKLIVLISLLALLDCKSQTRFYFHSTLASPISPSIKSDWDITGSTFRMMYPSKTKFSVSSVTTNFTSGSSGSAAPHKQFMISFQSQPLAAQTINSGGTISFQLRGNKNASAPTAGFIAYIRKCDGDGTNITEIATTGTSNSLPTGTATNKTFSATIGSNVTVTAGQRLIIEIGLNYTSGTVTTLTGSFVACFIIPANGDLPVDNTSTSALNPWAEFSQTLIFIPQGMPAL